MNREEFLKQMVAFGQELLAEEQKPKLNQEARASLTKLYDSLATAVNTAGDLDTLFTKTKDKRKAKALKAIELIMKVQELMNPLAEDDDIDLV